MLEGRGRRNGNREAKWVSACRRERGRDEEKVERGERDQMGRRGTLWL